MWSVYLLSFCAGILGSHAAAVRGFMPDTRSCRMVVMKDGNEADTFVTAWGGILNMVDCDVVCPGVPISPAIQWFRVQEQRPKKIPTFRKRVYSVRSHFGSTATLTFKNFLEKDTGLYRCRAWLGGYQGWVERDIQVRYGCHAPGFMCDNSRCLSANKMCNGVADCNDGLDERYCDGGDCPDDEFFCDNTCIQREFVCDGYYYCKDERDEEFCDERITEPITEPSNSTVRPTTPTTTAQGTTSSRLCHDAENEGEYNYAELPPCIDEDENVDTDIEAGTATTISIEGCHGNDFMCDNSRCLPVNKMCDGVFDCDDGLDESNCDGCVDSDFTCDDGSCISQSTWCDGFPDCIDGSDEMECPESTTTEPTTIEPTTTEPTTIEPTTIEPTTTEPTTIEPTTIKPTTIEPTTTEPNSGNVDYEYSFESEEEEGANENTTKLTTEAATTIGPQETTTIQAASCFPDVEFACPDGQCIPIDWKCDSYDDCAGATDEQNCSVEEDGCLTSQFACYEGLCIDNNKVCDGVQDCSFAEDEEDCGCKDDELMCGNGSCVPLSRRCDQFPDCDDESDEAWCDNEKVCPESMIPCEDKTICYLKDQKCDGYANCNDQSDERDCPTTTVPTTQAPMTQAPAGNTTSQAEDVGDNAQAGTGTA